MGISCIYLGYSSEALEAEKEEIKKTKLDFDDIMVEINSEDYRIFDEFAKCFPHCEATVRVSSIEEHLKFQIIEALPPRLRKDYYMNMGDYQRRWQALKNKEFDIENAFTVDEPNLFDFIEELSLGENHIRINLFISEVTDIELQRIINSLLLKHNKNIAINLYTSKKELVSYGLFYGPGDILHQGEDYKEVMSESLKEERRKKMVLENDENLKRISTFQPAIKLDKPTIELPKSTNAYAFKPLTTIEEIDYYGMEDIMKLLPISILPISKEIIDEYQDCHNLKKLYERLYLETCFQRYIGISRRVCLLGLDLFKKKNLSLVRSSKYSASEIVSNMGKNVSYYGLVEDYYLNLCNYIIKFLSDYSNRSLRFLPIMTNKSTGSYGDLTNVSRMKDSLLSEEESVIKAVITYNSANTIKKLLNGECEEGIKRLIFTPKVYNDINKKAWK